MMGSALMSQATSITVPLWLFVLLVALASWAAVGGLFLPSLRWYLRRRADRVLDEVAAKLKSLRNAGPPGK